MKLNSQASIEKPLRYWFSYCGSKNLTIWFEVHKWSLNKHSVEQWTRLAARSRPDPVKVNKRMQMPLTEPRTHRQHHPANYWNVFASHCKCFCQLCRAGCDMVPWYWDTFKMHQSPAHADNDGQSRGGLLTYRGVACSLQLNPQKISKSRYLSMYSIKITVLLFHNLTLTSSYLPTRCCSSLCFNLYAGLYIVLLINIYEVAKPF